jgi:hypothetical protein
MADLNFCGTTLAVVVASPATIDVAGFAALSWTATLPDLIDITELGDTSQDIPIPYLSGRVSHVNGAVDAGEVTITYAWETSNAAQVILRANANNNTAVSVRVTDPDGRIAYFSGVVANVRDVARNNTAYKGQTAVFRVRTPFVRN